MDYQIEVYEAEVPVEEFMEACVDVPVFLECCKACPNYGNLWSCPPYEFQPEEYWRQYKTLYIRGRKILFPEEMTRKTYAKEEQQKIMEQVLGREKDLMGEELFLMEQEYPNSVSLSAGSCSRCRRESCTRREAKPCRYPEKLRYSIESLGGNVGLTVTKYLKQELLWMEEDRLPGHFMLVAGLLKK